MNRLSTTQLYTMFNHQISGAQGEMVNLSKQLNEGTRFTNAYDDPINSSQSLRFKAMIDDNDQRTRARSFAKSDIEITETTLNSIKESLDRTRELTVQAASDTMDASAKEAISYEIRSLGENLVKLANTKAGNRFIFSGQQSDIPTFRLNEGTPFNTAIYKNGVDNGNERFIEAIETSINIEDTYLNTAQTAKFTSPAMSPMISANGSLDIEVDDGNGNITNFNVVMTAGDNIGAIVANINAAFVGAGGLGAIADSTNPVNYLTLDTALIAGNNPGSTAEIRILPTTTDSIVQDLHMNTINISGQSQGILNTLTDIENALAVNDGVSLRASIIDLDSNISDILSLQSKMGATSQEIDLLDDNSSSLRVQLAKDLSAIRDVDFAENSAELSNANTTLQTAIQTAASFFSSNLNSFLGGF